jgi:thioredoxin 1
MLDLEIAKKHLNENSVTLCIVKNGKIIFKIASHGVSGFLEAIEKLGDKLEGASLADRIVGKAVALLCAYAKVSAIYAIVLSKNARETLEENMVYHEWKRLVENILDASKIELCPFEKLAMEISSPKDAYERLKALQTSLRRTDERGMSGEQEQFISEEDAELNRIRERKVRELLGNEEREKMSLEPILVTDSNFNEIVKKHSLVLIDFWAPWCGPCRALAPTIEELTKEYAGKVTIGELNVDENPETAEFFQVYSIPTMLIMKDGCEVDRIVGLVPKKRMEAVLSKHLG